MNDSNSTIHDPTTASSDTAVAFKNDTTDLRGMFNHYENETTRAFVNRFLDPRRPHPSSIASTPFGDQNVTSTLPDPGSNPTSPLSNSRDLSASQHGVGSFFEGLPSGDDLELLEGEDEPQDGSEDISGSILPESTQTPTDTTPTLPYATVNDPKMSRGEAASAQTTGNPSSAAGSLNLQSTGMMEESRETPDQSLTEQDIRATDPTSSGEPDAPMAASVTSEPQEAFNADTLPSNTTMPSRLTEEESKMTSRDPGDEATTTPRGEEKSLLNVSTSSQGGSSIPPNNDSTVPSTKGDTEGKLKGQRRGKGKRKGKKNPTGQGDQTAQSEIDELAGLLIAENEHQIASASGTTIEAQPSTVARAQTTIKGSAYVKSVEARLSLARAHARKFRKRAPDDCSVIALEKKIYAAGILWALDDAVDEDYQLIERAASWIGGSRVDEILKEVSKLPSLIASPSEVQSWIGEEMKLLGSFSPEFSERVIEYYVNSLSEDEDGFSVEVIAKKLGEACDKYPGKDSENLYKTVDIEAKGLSAMGDFAKTTKALSDNEADRSSRRKCLSTLQTFLDNYSSSARSGGSSEINVGTDKVARQFVARWATEKHEQDDDRSLLSKQFKLAESLTDALGTEHMRQIIVDYLANKTFDQPLIDVYDIFKSEVKFPTDIGGHQLDTTAWTHLAPAVCLLVDTSSQRNFHNGFARLMDTLRKTHQNREVDYLVQTNLTGVFEAVTEPIFEAERSALYKSIKRGDTSTGSGAASSRST